VHLAGVFQERVQRGESEPVSAPRLPREVPPSQLAVPKRRGNQLDRVAPRFRDALDTHAVPLHKTIHLHSDGEATILSPQSVVTAHVWNHVCMDRP